MTLPALPAQGSTSWYTWASGIHSAVASGGSGGGSGVGFNVRSYGAAGDGTTDDTAAFNAAVTAAAGTTAGRVVIPNGGKWKINGRVTVPDGVSLSGEGSNSNSDYSATTLLLGATGAGVTVNGSGGFIQDLFIDGNNVATSPLIVNLGANRTFLRVEVRRATQDNITINKLQNSSFIACTSDNSGRDALVLDLGAGGLQFLRFNVSDPGRHALYVQQSGTSPETGYDKPQHISFDHCIFERPTSDNALVKFANGFFHVFNNCIFAGGLTQTVASSLMELGTAIQWIALNSCEWYGAGIAGQIAVKVGGSSRITVDGTNWMTNLGYFVDSPTTGLAQVNGDVFLGGGVFATAATPDNLLTRYAQVSTLTTKGATTGVVQSGAVTGDAGERFRLYADGSLRWGSGADYTFASGIYRRSDGLVGIDGGLAIGGTQWATRGSTPVTKPTVTGSRGGNAALASLLTALASQGLITDSTTA